MGNQAQATNFFRKIRYGGAELIHINDWALKRAKYSIWPLKFVLKKAVLAYKKAIRQS